jgi:hypothetical protein
VVPSPTKKPSRSRCFGRLESPSNCLSQGSFNLSSIIMIAKLMTRQPIRPIACQILITSVVLTISFMANSPVERLSNNHNYQNTRLMSSLSLEKMTAVGGHPERSRGIWPAYPGSPGSSRAQSRDLARLSGLAGVIPSAGI